MSELSQIEPVPAAKPWLAASRPSGPDVTSIVLYIGEGPRSRHVRPSTDSQAVVCLASPAPMIHPRAT